MRSRWLAAVVLAVAPAFAERPDAGAQEVQVTKKRKPPRALEPIATTEEFPPRPGAQIDAASCTTQAKAYALSQRGMKCPTCSSYAVVPKQGSEESYTCCTCGRIAPYSGFVSIHR